MPLYFDLNKTYNERVSDFTKFKEKYPNWQKKFDVIETNPKLDYGRILLHWEEEACKCGHENCGQPHPLNHIYASAIDLKSGDIYLDCTTRKLWAKNLLGIGLRPIVLIGKTLSHILFIPIIMKLVEILKQDKSERKWSELKTKCWQSMADIVRTPVYETAMIITHVVSVIFAGFYPPILYKVRQVVGQLELKINRITEDLYDHIFIAGEGWVLMPCFVPICNLANLLLEKDKDNEENIRKNLSQKGMRLITYRREYCEPLNDCGQLYPDNIPYVSASTPKEAK